jgi:hypothetical protein
MASGALVDEHRASIIVGMPITPRIERPRFAVLDL